MAKVAGGNRREHSMYVIAILLFLIVIFLPPVYILSYSLKTSLTLSAGGKAALINSFMIGVVVTLVDVLIGLPVAWIMARRRNMRFRNLIDTLIDMPLVVPTSVLGLSVFYFWGDGLGTLFGVEGGLIGKGPLLITLLHIVFTFPYMVRSIEAAIAQIDISQEQAATMLGASTLTVFRTISLPLFKEGLIAGSILSFTRSLSETGATMMVAGAFSTAPTIVVAYKNASNIPEAAAVSVILIVMAVAILILARIFSGGFRVPIIHVWPVEERALSRRYFVLRDILLSLLVMSLILLPTFYIALSGIGSLNAPALQALASDRDLVGSTLVSFALACVVTVLNLALAIPVALAVRKNIFHSGGIIETMSDAVLMVPTSALGLSLALFWGNFALNDYMVLVLAHLSFTFPLTLKPIVAALRGVDHRLEDAAMTLGASPSVVFKTIVYPLIKPALIAGVIMTFMRSLSETGATLSVTKNIKTIPVLLVEIFNKGTLDEKTILASIMLFAISALFIISLKRLELRKNEKT